MWVAFLKGGSWVGGAGSCQKEEIAVNVLAEGCVECQRGRWSCFFFALGAAGQKGSGWWVQMGTPPRPKLARWCLTA